MSVELAVLCDVVERLTSHDVPYMLTDSMAMNFYAEPRMTRDLYQYHLKRITFFVIASREAAWQSINP